MSNQKVQLTVWLSSLYRCKQVIVEKDLTLNVQYRCRWRIAGTYIYVDSLESVVQAILVLDNCIDVTNRLV